MADIYFEPPPPGGDENRRGEVIASIATTLSVATLLVSLRVYVRANITRSFSWDDFLILLSLAITFASVGTTAQELYNGLGRHAYYINPLNLIELGKFDYISQFLVIISMLFSKISFCLFLLKLFATHFRWRLFFYLLIAFITATYLAAAIVIFPQCTPTAKLWNPLLPGDCLSQATQIGVYHYQGAVAITCDCVLSFLPVVFLWNIQISWKNKVAICALMGLGLFTAACAITRSILVGSLSSSDPSWDLVDLYVWTATENHMSIIAATLPTIRPLWSKDIRSRYKRTGYVADQSSRGRRNHEKLSNDSSTETNTVRDNTDNTTGDPQCLYDHRLHGAGRGDISVDEIVV